MAKFAVKEKATLTKNMAGAPAYKESARLELTSLVLTNFLKDQFYRKGTDAIVSVQTLAKQIPPRFSANLALYARHEFGMRSVSHVIAGEIAHNVKGEKWLRPFFRDVIRRPDDITEILAYYGSNYGGKFPHALCDGLGLAFAKFGNYQLAKYRGEGHSATLVDAVNICHPKPTEKNQEALKLLMSGKLVSEGTWESEMTKAGNAESDEDKAENKKDVWIKLIREKKLPYFALLRNLRNILEQAPEVTDEACSMLLNPDAIHKSLVLPFRFLTAIGELQEKHGSATIIDTLYKAVDIALDNVPELTGSTAVIVDVSGSMGSWQDSKSPLSIASLFGAALAKKNRADLYAYASSSKKLSLYQGDSLVTVAKGIAGLSTSLGGGTNLNTVFPVLAQKYDRLFILSDMQNWEAGSTPHREYAEYRKRENASPKIWSFDLQGYGTLQFPEDSVYAIAGFSEKVFDLIPIMENGIGKLIDVIEKYEAKR